MNENRENAIMEHPGENLTHGLLIMRHVSLLVLWNGIQFPELVIEGSNPSSISCLRQKSTRVCVTTGVLKMDE